MTEAEWFRQKLASLGFTLASFARWQVEHGDDREMDAVVRCNGRMANGETRVSGEMKALLGMLEQVWGLEERQNEILRGQDPVLEKLVDLGAKLWDRVEAKPPKVPVELHLHGTGWTGSIRVELKEGN